VADGVRTCLSIAEVSVLSRNSSEKLKASGQRLEEMHRARVEKYLEGTARLEKDTVSLSVNLIDAATEAIVWARLYDWKLEGGLTAVIDKISMDVARQVRQPLAEGQLQTVQKRSSPNLEAVIAFYAGNEAEKKYRDNGREEDFVEGRRLYQKAVALDPDYCLAYVSLGDLYEARYVETNEPADLRTMVQAYQKGHDLNPSVPEAHAGLGWAYFHQGQFDSAYASFKRALVLAPNDAGANYGAGSFLRSVGLDELAIRHYETAIEFDPMDYVKYYLAAASYWTIGDYRNADLRMRQALALNPDSQPVMLWHTRILIATGNLDEAERELAAAEKMPPVSPDVKVAIRSRRALIAALRGNKEEALAQIRGDQRPYRYEITNIYSLSGMNDEAIPQIKKGNEEAFDLVKDYLYSYTYLTTNPFFAGLRDDPRFQEIVRKEEAKYQAKLKKYGDL